MQGPLSHLNAVGGQMIRSGGAGVALVVPTVVVVRLVIGVVVVVVGLLVGAG